MNIETIIKKSMEINNNDIDDADPPKITVIVLTYKNQKRLFATIDSILEQSYPNLQLIVSDDESGVFEKLGVEQFIAQKAGGNLKSYLVRINEANMGTVAHMNFTAGLAEGQYIKFLACGDAFCQKDALERLAAFAQSQRMPVVTSKSVICSDDFSVSYYEFPDSRRVKRLNNCKADQLFELLADSNIISAVGTIFHRNFFKQMGGFDESYHLLEDWPCWLRLAREGYSIPCLDQIIGFYAEGGVSSKDGTAFEAGSLKEDMILCYEKEILPNIRRFSRRTRRFIDYQYKRLKEDGDQIGLRRMCFILKYLPFESRRKIKRMSKKALIAFK